MNQLTRILARPDEMAHLSLAQWDDLLRFARYAGMLGTLHALAEEYGCWEQAPREARETMESSTVYSGYMQRIARHELRKLAALFEDAGYPVVLLKGAAYLQARLPVAAGRRLNDIDILVPRAALADAEGRLQRAGWEFPDDLEEYDLHYYREWTHELPPFRHTSSYMELDVHHSLIQPTGRIRLDPGLLFDGVREVKGTEPFAVLSPEDMFLHSATHLFMSDELRGGLRDLYDMHRLALHFAAADPGYWDKLVARAGRLDMLRPLYYAVGSMKGLLESPVPENAWLALQQARPNALVNGLMRRIVHRHIAPRNVEKLHSPFAEWLLYVRSHWVRMPPLMLARHLARKWWMERRKPRESYDLEADA